MITHAMILAAGRGERMRPLTDHTPKSLLTVNGQALIDRHLIALSQAGFQHVVINLGHLGAQIKAHVGSGQALGLSIRYSQEPEGALETAGGIALAKPWQTAAGENNPAPFLVINADVYTDWPASAAHTMAADLKDHHAQAHLVLVANPPQHPAGDFGLTQTPGWVTRKTIDNHLTFSGIGVYDPIMFNPLTPGVKAPLAPMLFDLIDRKACRGSAHTGQWNDVGTPERLANLNAMVAPK
jgi:N-acetyl-alpha-D-muramate 1-phosphate uridylyltransferase